MPRIQIFRQADIDGPQFADKLKGGQFQQTLLDGGHGEGEAGRDGFGGGPACVAIDAGGTIDREDEDGRIDFGEEGIYFFEDARRLFLKGEFDARPKQSIQQDIRLVKISVENFMVAIDRGVSELAARR